MQPDEDLKVLCWLLLINVIANEIVMVFLFIGLQRTLLPRFKLLIIFASKKRQPLHELRYKMLLWMVENFLK